MSKREIATNADNDIEAPRLKRRKDVPQDIHTTNNIDPNEPGASSDQDNDDAEGVEIVDGPKLNPEEVRDEGLKVLQVLKGAVNKEWVNLKTRLASMKSQFQ